MWKSLDLAITEIRNHRPDLERIAQWGARRGDAADSEFVRAVFTAMRYLIIARDTCDVLRSLGIDPHADSSGQQP